jgi:hypothetical protein
LNLANPDRQPRQLGGIVVDLDAPDRIGADRRKSALQAQRLGLQPDPMFDVFKDAQGDVQKIPGAAGRIEDTEDVKSTEKAM